MTVPSYFVAILPPRRPGSYLLSCPRRHYKHSSDNPGGAESEANEFAGSMKLTRHEDHMKTASLRVLCAN